MSLSNNVSASTKKTIKEQAPRVLEAASEKYLPPNLRKALETGQRLASADIDEFKNLGLETLLLGNQFQVVRQTFLNTNNPLMGGITPLKASRLVEGFVKRAQQNLFLLSIAPIDGSSGGALPEFNMFATSVEYDPFTVSGDGHKVGGALVDSVAGNEAVEMRITTHDDELGTLKRWYAQMHERVAAGDGTVGVPASYGLRIRVTHAFYDPPSSAYTDDGLYRAANLGLSLSRSDNSVAELQMTFQQIDTFWK
jgi:hypothetical protein